MNYEWPSEEYRAAAIAEAKGNETLAIERHKRDKVELEMERKARVWMEKQGWVTASDGSWRNRAGDNGRDVYSAIMQGMRDLARKENRP